MLPGQGDHADQHLGVQRGHFGIEPASLELRGEQVLNLIGDIADQARETTGGLGHW